jgi:WD40 repeat protein
MSKHLIISVHGIWTPGDWQERLRSALLAAEPGAVVHGCKFGVVSAYSLFPGRREAKATGFADELLAELTRKSWERIDIVAHSFGTYIVAEALRHLARNRDPATLPKVHTLILAGSVLPRTYPLRELVPGLVSRVVNDCGIHDRVLLCPELLLPGLGFAGRVGFLGLCGHDVHNRWFSFGHSGYFSEVPQSGGDEFMKAWWLPLLTRDEPVPQHDARGARRFRALVGWLERQVHPLRTGLIAMGCAAAALAVWKVAEHQNAVLRKHNQELVAESWALQSVQRRDTSPVEAARLAIASAVVHRTPQSDHALLGALQTSAKPVAQLQPWGVRGLNLIGMTAAGDKIAEVSFDRNGNAELRLHEQQAGPAGRTRSLQVPLQGCAARRQPERLDFTRSGRYLVLQAFGGSCVLDTSTLTWKWSLPGYDNVIFTADESAFYAARSPVAPDGGQRPPLVSLIDTSGAAAVEGLRESGWIHSSARLGTSGAVFADATGSAWVVRAAHSRAEELLPEFASLGAKQVAAAADGARIAVGTEPGQLILLDSTGLKRQWSLTLKAPPARIRFSPDGRRLGVLLVDGTAVVLATKDGSPVAGFNGDGYPLDLAFLDDAGDRLLTVNRDTHLKVWDVSAQSLSMRVPVPVSGDRYAFDARGEAIAVTAGDGTTTVWNAAWRKEAESMRVDEGIAALAVSGGGRYVAALGHSEQLRLWDTSNGQRLLDLVATENGTRRTWHSHLTLSEHAESVALVDESGLVRAWQPGKGEVFRLQLPRLFAESSQQGTSVFVRWLPQATDTRLLQGCSTMVPAYLGDAHAAQPGVSIKRECRLFNPTAGWPRGAMSTDLWNRSAAIAFNADGRLLALSFLGDVLVFDIDTGGLLHRLALDYERRSPALLQHGEAFAPPIVAWIAFSSDDRRLLVGTKPDEITGLPGNALTSWDLQRASTTVAERKTVYLDHSHTALGLLANARSVVTVAAQNGQIDFRDEETLQPARSLGLPRHIDQVAGFAWQPNALLVLSHDTAPGPPNLSRSPRIHVDLYDRHTLSHMQHLSIPYPVDWLTLTPDGGHLLVSDELGNASTLELSSGRTSAQFTLDAKPRSVWFGKDGELFYTSGASLQYANAMAGEGQIRSLVWNTGRLTAQLCATLRPQDRHFADLAEKVGRPITCDAVHAPPVRAQAEVAAR